MIKPISLSSTSVDLHLHLNQQQGILFGKSIISMDFIGWKYVGFYVLASFVSHLFSYFVLRSLGQLS